MKIKGTNLIEVSPSEFQVQFKYKKDVLQTPSLPNATTKDELTALLRNMCGEYDTKRAEGNLDEIKAFLANDPIEL
jgi:hypothetical protein